MVDVNKKIDLNGFTGSENLYKDQLGAVITDGVRHFATEAEAFWFVSDAIVICKVHEKVKKEPFVAVKVGSKDHKACIRYEDGNGLLLYVQDYKSSSLPNGTWTFYFTDNTLLLPGEY